MGESRQDREYELKFRARPADLERFKKAVEAACRQRRAWEVIRQSDQYYDTKERHLAQKSVALRVRRANGAAKVTVKADNNSSGGLMDRMEWERPVTGEGLDLTALPEEARQALGAETEPALAPALSIDTERHSLNARRGGAGALLVQAVADSCRVSADQARAEFAECELELLEGDSTQFFALAAEVHARCPLPMSGLAKVQQAKRLVGGEKPAVYKIPKFSLTQGQSLHEALRDIFTRCVGNIVDNQEACLEGSDPEGVHQMRVSLRRLRSALLIYRKYLARGAVGWIDPELQWLANALGPARDWDVYVTETLARVQGYGIDETAHQALRAAAEDRRQAAYAQVRTTLQSDRFAKLIFRLTSFTALQGWLLDPSDLSDPLHKPLGKTGKKVLKQRYTKVMKAARPLAEMDMKSRHKVRLKLKSLRYAVDFMREVYPGPKTQAFMKTLHRLQDDFGQQSDVSEAVRLTDLLAAEADDRREALQLAAGQLRGWYAHALHDVEPKLLEAWDTFATTPPFWGGKPYKPVP